MNPSHRLSRRLRGFMQRTMPLMITCGELDVVIVDYLDGGLSEKQRFVFRLHLLFCRECRDYIVGYRRAIEMGKAAFTHPDDSVPEDVPEDLVRAVLAAQRASRDD